VSVTNLTADIEALSATNAAQDALIADNLYTTGTTNKTLIDAEIAVELLPVQTSVAKIETELAATMTASDIRNLGIILQSSAFSSSPRGIGLGGQSNALSDSGTFNSETNKLTEAMRMGTYGGFMSVSNRVTTSGDYYGGATNLMLRSYAGINNGTWGIELPIGSWLQKALGGNTYWYKSAVGGASGSSFYNGGAYWPLVTGAYESATNKWAEAPAPEWYIWMQGETGSTSLDYAACKTRDETIISDLRAYYGNADMKVILVGLPITYYTNTYGAAADLAKYDIAQADTNVFFVSMRDIPLTSGHYTAKQLVDDVAPRIYNVILTEEVRASDYENGLNVSALSINGAKVVASVPQTNNIIKAYNNNSVSVAAISDFSGQLYYYFNASNDSIDFPLSQSATSVVSTVYFPDAADTYGLRLRVLYYSVNRDTGATSQGTGYDADINATNSFWSFSAPTPATFTNSNRIARYVKFITSTATGLTYTTNGMALLTAEEICP